MLAWYYRLLGATIGDNVTISTRAVIGEPDLVTIGDGCVLDGPSHCRVRSLEKRCYFSGG